MSTTAIDYNNGIKRLSPAPAAGTPAEYIDTNFKQIADTAAFLAASAPFAAAVAGAQLSLTDGATVTIDPTEGNLFTLTCGATASRQITATASLQAGQVFSVIVTQNGGGGKAVTWDTMFKFPGGVAPTMTTTASKKDVYTFIAFGAFFYQFCAPVQNL